MVQKPEKKLNRFQHMWREVKDELIQTGPKKLQPVNLIAALGIAQSGSGRRASDASTKQPLSPETPMVLVRARQVTLRSAWTDNEEKLGMGVRFTDVQLDQNEILDGWLAALVR